MSDPRFITPDEAQEALKTLREYPELIDDDAHAIKALRMIAGARVEYLPQVQVKADGGERFWNRIGAPCATHDEAQHALDNLHKHIKNHYWVKGSARVTTRYVIDMEEQ